MQASHYAVGSHYSGYLFERSTENQLQGSSQTRVLLRGMHTQGLATSTMALQHRLPYNESFSPRGSSDAATSRLPEVVVSRQRRSDLNFGQKLLDLWHRRSGFILSGAIMGGLLGAGLGAVLGGPFSVPGAIVGAMVGVPVGVIISLMLGDPHLDVVARDPFAAYAGQVESPLPPPPSVHRQVPISDVPINHGSELVDAPTLKPCLNSTAADLPAEWQKRVSRWARDGRNFVLANQAVERDWLKNLTHAKAYLKEVVRGYTEGLGWDKIKGYLHVQTEHAILDFGRMAPGAPKHVPADLFQGLQNTNVRAIGINASLSVETLPEDLFVGQGQLKDLAIHNNRYEHLLMVTGKSLLPETGTNLMTIADEGGGKFCVRTFDAAGKVTDVGQVSAATAARIQAYRVGAEQDEARFIEALSAELKCPHPPVPFTSLRYLPEGIFRDLKNLEDLTLSNNKFDTLPNGIFKNQRQLKRLDLSHNNFYSLPDDIFENMEALVEVDLRGNPIQELPNSLQKLPHVRVLWDKA